MASEFWGQSIWTRSFWKSWAFVSLVTALVLWAGWAWHQRDGLLWAVPVVLSINYFLLIHSGWRVIGAAPERPLDGNDGWSLNKQLSELCSKAQVRPPNVVVMDCNTPQAFLAGRYSRFSTLYVTQGFLDRLDATEREAVLALEVAALKLHMQFNFFVLGAFFGLVFGILSGFDRLIAKAIGIQRHWPRSWLLWLAWPVLFFVQRWCLSPRDYFRLDEVAAELSGNREALCQALWKLESSCWTQPIDARPAWTHVFAVGPWGPGGPLWYLQPQPSAKRRILQLNGGFPL